MGLQCSSTVKLVSGYFQYLPLEHETLTERGQVALKFEEIRLKSVDYCDLLCKKIFQLLKRFICIFISQKQMNDTLCSCLGDLFVHCWSDRHTCYSGTMVTRLGPIPFAGYLWMGQPGLNCSGVRFLCQEIQSKAKKINESFVNSKRLSITCITHPM